MQKMAGYGHLWFGSRTKNSWCQLESVDVDKPKMCDKQTSSSTISASLTNLRVN